jgi:hypothetical protein
MNVINFQWYERARELYARYRNCHEVWQHLKEEGCKFKYGTIAQWYRRNKQEWHEIADGYNTISKQNAVQCFQEQSLRELRELKDALSKRVNGALKNPKEKIDSQSVFALRSLIAELNFLFKSMQPKKDSVSETVNIVMDVLLAHPVIGPQLVQFKTDITKEIEKRMKRK